MRILILMSAVLCLASCGGSSSEGGQPNAAAELIEVRTYYESGELESVGSATADNLRHGEWRWYYEENGGLYLRITFENGMPNESAEWELYNKHGSLRANNLDGAYVFERLWE